VLCTTAMDSGHGHSHGASMCACPIMWIRTAGASAGQPGTDCPASVAANRALAAIAARKGNVNVKPPAPAEEMAPPAQRGAGAGPVPLTCSQTATAGWNSLHPGASTTGKQARPIEFQAPGLCHHWRPGKVQLPARPRGMWKRTYARSETSKDASAFSGRSPATGQRRVRSAGPDGPTPGGGCDLPNEFSYDLKRSRTAGERNIRAIEVSVIDRYEGCVARRANGPDIVEVTGRELRMVEQV